MGRNRGDRAFVTPAQVARHIHLGSTGETLRTSHCHLVLFHTWEPVPIPWACLTPRKTLLWCPCTEVNKNKVKPKCTFLIITFWLFFFNWKEVAEPLLDLKEGIDQLENNKTLGFILSTLLAIGNFLNGTNVSVSYLLFSSLPCHKIPALRLLRDVVPLVLQSTNEQVIFVFSCWKI